jgi:hypothetical protein
VPVPPMQGTREPAGLLWRTWPGTPHGGPGQLKSRSAGLDPVGLLWWTRAPSQTNERSEFIDMICNEVQWTVLLHQEFKFMYWTTKSICLRLWRRGLHLRFLEILKSICCTLTH